MARLFEVRVSSILFLRHQPLLWLIKVFYDDDVSAFRPEIRLRSVSVCKQKSFTIILIINLRPRDDWIAG